MKKILTAIALFIASAFLTISSVKAATKVVFNETSNGNVNTTLHFEEGFVGGIDLKLKISGNVDYKSFNLNSNIANKKYTTKVDYDNKNNTLNVLIVTGGVGSSYNLLNNKKELDLGTLVVSSDSKSDVSYSIECTGLTVLDNAWSSSTPSFEEVDNKLTYTVQKEDEDHKDDPNPNNPDNKPDDNNDSDNNNENNNNNQGNDNPNSNLNGGTTNNGSTNNSNNGNNNTSSNNGSSSNDKDNDNDEDDKGDDEKDEDDDKDDNTNKTEDNDKVVTNDKENKPSEDKHTSKLWFIIPIVVIIAGAAVVYVILKRKKKPNNEFDI